MKARPIPNYIKRRRNANRSAPRLRHFVIYFSGMNKALNQNTHYIHPIGSAMGIVDDRERGKRVIRRTDPSGLGKNERSSHVSI